jgi:hypothetical protein
MVHSGRVCQELAPWRSHKAKEACASQRRQAAALIDIPSCFMLCTQSSLNLGKVQVASCPPLTQGKGLLKFWQCASESQENLDKPPPSVLWGGSTGMAIQAGSPLPALCSAAPVSCAGICDLGSHMPCKAKAH